MAPNDFVVPPLSWKTIEAMSNSFLQDFGLADTPYFPVMQLLENVLDSKLGLVTLQVSDEIEMRGSLGHTDPNGQFIELLESVYNGAWNNNPRDRFTATHEVAHWILHTRVPLQRCQPGQAIGGYQSAEAQANRMTADLMMPKRFITEDDTVATLTARHGVSRSAAKIRIKSLSEEGYFQANEKRRRTL